MELLFSLSIPFSPKDIQAIVEPPNGWQNILYLIICTLFGNTNNKYVFIGQPHREHFIIIIPKSRPLT